jgi:nucleotide-binding universal stress UspA family protein
MSDERVIVVAVEDIGTAGVVGAAAARIAIDQNATRVVLVHVLDSHTFATGLFGMTGAAAPVLESEEEANAVLSLAEAAFRAEYEALEHPVPAIVRELPGGNPGAVIPEVARREGAAGIVVGARRPHAFGRLAHPDVRSALGSQVDVPVYVAPLQSSE